MSAASNQEHAKNFMIASQLQQAGKLDEAEKIYKDMLRQIPNHPFVLFNMGLICHSKGMIDKAKEHYSKAIVAKPDFSEAYYNLADIYKSRKDLAEAKKFYEYAIRCNDKLVQAHYSLGILLREMGQIAPAIQSLKNALALRPNAETYSNIGSIYHTEGKFDEAYKYYIAALEKEPNHIRTLNNLGAVYSVARRYDEAEQIYNRLLELNPHDMVAFNHKCILLKTIGRLDEAIAQYKQGLKIDPQNTAMFSNMLLAMLYASSVTPEELSETACEFGRTIADPLLRKRELKVDKNPDRKLKIGYVSPDFRNHAVHYFVEHLIKNHDRNYFEVFAYSNTDMTDAITERLQKEFDHWHDIRNKTDDEAADMIEADKIDILIDLTGHTGKNRPLVFARKPAPIQVNWLGYPATTGMKAMDYRITDIYSEPAGMTEHLNIEKLYRLPQIFCCYGGHESNPAVIDHPPFEDNGHITFGCFNNFSKVTDDVLRIWARIMQEVPGSRLLLEIAGVESTKYKAEVENRISQAGFAQGSVIIEPRKRENQFVLYNKIDIALDPFPCAGGTTSMDAMWMGVPFVTLAGKHFVSRMGVTILSNVGLTELIADNIQEYISKTIALSTDRERLKVIRHNLRQKVEASPMMDQRAFCKNMEDAYRTMWKNYCAGGN